MKYKIGQEFIGWDYDYKYRQLFLFVKMRCGIPYFCYPYDFPDNKNICFSCLNYRKVKGKKIISQVTKQQRKTA